MSLKTTTQEFINQLREIFDDRYDYSYVEYTGRHSKVHLVCPIHGDFYQTPHILKYRRIGCRQCGRDRGSDKRRLGIDAFIKRAKEVHGDKYDYSQVTYVNNTTKVTITCPHHGPFDINPVDHIYSKQGCRPCGLKSSADAKRKSVEQFIQEARLIHGDKYDYSKVQYKNNATKVILICDKHGEFKMAPANHILKEQGCAKCKSSKGEAKIREWLTTHNIDFQEQKKFTKCRSKAMLAFDFYIPSLNLLIEYDGIQHFEPISYGYGPNSDYVKSIFERTQLHDKIKNDFAINNSKSLLRIPYTHFDQVERILESVINNTSVCYDHLFIVKM